MCERESVCRPVAAITDSAAFSAACIYSTVEEVRESLPEGFYSMKVRMSASSSQAGPIGEGRGKWLTVLSVHISCVFAVIFNSFNEIWYFPVSHNTCFMTFWLYDSFLPLKCNILVQNAFCNPYVWYKILHPEACSAMILQGGCGLQREWPVVCGQEAISHSRQENNDALLGRRAWRISLTILDSEWGNEEGIQT